MGTDVKETGEMSMRMVQWRGVTKIKEPSEGGVRESNCSERGVGLKLQMLECWAKGHELLFGGKGQPSEVPNWARKNRASRS